MSHLTLPPTAVDYPSSDGKPLAENDAQLAAILYAVGALRVYFGAREDVYVPGDLLIYYEEGNPRVSVAPDAFVVFGVEDRVRMNYKVREEGKGPEFVLEVASRSTWREDVGRKLGVYAGLGVREYFLYDPRGGVPGAAVAGASAGRWSVRASGGGGVDRQDVDDAQRDAGAGTAGERRGDALPRPGDGAGPSRPSRGARRAAGRICRAPDGRVPSQSRRSAYRGARATPWREVSPRVQASASEFT